MLVANIHPSVVARWWRPRSRTRADCHPCPDRAADKLRRSVLPDGHAATLARVIADPPGACGVARQHEGHQRFGRLLLRSVWHILVQRTVLAEITCATFEEVVDEGSLGAKCGSFVTGA